MSQSDKNDQPVLMDAFENNFYIGAALNVEQITGKEPKAMDVVARHFNSITPENIMKWEEIHPEPGRYNFVASDQYVAFGEKHNMHIICHALVWFLLSP
ncbi:MAG: endo-1,4-beta-xylanase, partial [Calditrichaceae bacterium]